MAESRLPATLCALMVWLSSWLLLSGARIARGEVLPPVSTAASVLSFCPLPLSSGLPCVVGLTAGGVEATVVRWLLRVSLSPAATRSRGRSAVGAGVSGAAPGVGPGPGSLRLGSPKRAWLSSDHRTLTVEVPLPVSIAAPVLSACPLSLPSWLLATRGGCVVGVLPGLSWGLTTRGAEAAAECWLLLVLAVAGPWGWSAAGLGLSGAALWMALEPALSTGRAASLLAGFRVLFPPATGWASAGVVLLPPRRGA